MQLLWWGFSGNMCSTCVLQTCVFMTHSTTSQPAYPLLEIYAILLTVGPPSPNDNSLNSNDSALQFICIHKNEPNECLKAFLFLVSQTMPSHKYKYKDTHTYNIYIHTRIYNERTLYMLSNYDTIKTCVYGRILFEVYVLQSLLYACVYFARICRFLFVCMCIYLYVNVNGIVLVYLTGYVCIFIPLTLFSRFKRIP